MSTTSTILDKLERVSDDHRLTAFSKKHANNDNSVGASTSAKANPTSESLVTECILSSSWKKLSGNLDSMYTLVVLFRKS